MAAAISNDDDEAVIGRCRALLIDNYDSYSFNLYHLIAKVTDCEPILVQNDDFGGDWDVLLKALRDQYGENAFQCIVVGPGPGTPEDAKYLGLSEAAVKREDVNVPVLGVCLGMQAIVFAYGGRVVRAPQPMHGRLSAIEELRPSKLFENVSFPFKVVRYHSLAVDMRGTEAELVVTAKSRDDDVVMALEHRKRMLFGVQFHPESICAGYAGEQIMANFTRLAKQVQIHQRLIPSSVKRIKEDGKDGARHPEVHPEVSLRVYAVKDPNASAEEIYERLFRSADYRAWFDSAMEHPRRGKVSILCKQSSGGLGDRVEFFVDPSHRRMDIDATHSELRDAGDCILNIYIQSGEKWVLERTRRGRGCEPFSHMNQVLLELKPSNVSLTTIAGPDYAFQAEKQVSLDSLPLDFCCGYVGTLGYGLRKLCGVKQIPDESHEVKGSDGNHAHGTPDAAFFFCDQAIVFDHSSKTAFVLILLDPHENDASSPHWKHQSDWAKAAVIALVSNPTDHGHKTSPESVITPPVRLVPVRNAEEYQADVRSCLDRILEGETYEVCLTTQLIAENRSVDPNALYRNLRRHNPAPFCALYAFGDTFAVCSSSPERYLRVDANGLVESRPIKGTVRRGATEEEDTRERIQLENSEKDRAENLMIVDLVRNDLGRVCQVGTVSVPDLFVVESFRTVHQLVSTIQGRLKPGTTAVDAARAAFPPGSMTGSPKERTMQIIDSIEPRERGFYSGALGFFSLSGAADLSVIIRTALVEKNRVSVGAGGAVVALSDPLAEHQEMVLKVKALGSCFEVASTTASTTSASLT